MVRIRSYDLLLVIDDMKYFSMVLWRAGILHNKKIVLFKPMRAEKIADLLIHEHN